MPAPTPDQIVSRMMKAMYPRKGKESTPEQVILLNALKINGGLDAQIRACLSDTGRRKKAAAAEVLS